MQNGLSREEIKALLLKELELLKSEGLEGVTLATEVRSGRPTDGQKSANESVGTTPTLLDVELPNPTVGADEEPRPQEMAKKSGGPTREWNIAEIELPEGSKADRWTYLRDRVLNCPVCNSHLRPGKKLVFGVGNLDADIFLCGEAPGADEEVQGEPFVGRAGQLLTKIIEAMGLQRREVYIGNIMNWRPEMPTEYGNRPPTQVEMECCLPYLRAQIRIVQPKLIVALGLTAVNGLLGFDASRRMGELRGRWFEFENRPLMITYHPSYLLRNQSTSAKRMVWEDFLTAMEFLKMPISEKQRSFFL